MNSENGTRFVLHRCHAAADPTRRLIRQPLKVCRITLLATVVVLMTRPAAGQDNWLEQWTLHATDEGADIHQERMLSPSQNDERELTDNITRSDSGFARVRPEFDLADFTTDFAESPRNTEHLTRFRQEESEGSESTGEPTQELAEPFDAFGVSEEYLVDPPRGRELRPEAVFAESPGRNSRCEQWQVMPSGLLYHSYLAGTKEPRMQFLHLYDTRNDQTYWEAVLGGRVGLLRHGTVGAANPEGFQLDLEGGVFARVLPDTPSAELAASDYRAGIVTTWRRDGTAWKAGYYHISSHVGDEFLLANPLFTRINYVRDSLVVGTVRDLSLSSKIYGEIAYAIGHQGGAEPLELQLGAEYAPVARCSLQGAPFAAINGHLREEFDFSGGINFVSGWSWQGLETRHRLRLGMQYYNGPSLQYQFFDRWENLIGGGLWMDY